LTREAKRSWDQKFQNPGGGWGLVGETSPNKKKNREEEKKR